MIDSVSVQAHVHGLISNNVCTHTHYTVPHTSNTRPLRVRICSPEYKGVHLLRSLPCYAPRSEVNSAYCVCGIQWGIVWLRAPNRPPHVTHSWRSDPPPRPPRSTAPQGPLLLTGPGPSALGSARSKDRQSKARRACQCT